MYINRFTKFAIILFILSSLISFYIRYDQISNIDNNVPEIQVDKKTIVVSVNDPEETLLKGITAFDKKDGDITDSLIVESISNFYKNGTRNVRYVAFDSDNHVTRASRMITYSDYTSPEFSLISPLEFRVGTTNIIGGLSCHDCLDGDISSYIKVIPEDSFSINEPGEYLVTFQASNSAGDTSSFKATVVMYDSSINRGPQIDLSQYLVYLDKGADFDPSSYLRTVSINGRKYDLVYGDGNYNNPDRERNERIVVGINQISIDSNLDTSQPGSYRILYSMTVNAGNQETVTGYRRLCVVVRDN